MLLVIITAFDTKVYDSIMALQKRKHKSVDDKIAVLLYIEKGKSKTSVDHSFSVPLNMNKKQR